MCVFACLSTRNVHLDVAWGLDTDSFLNAFTRFTSRRGVPKNMISYNGTNFIGAVNEIKKNCGSTGQRQDSGNDCTERSKADFNPLGARHFGAASEVIVKEGNKAIYAVLNNSDVTDEELITVVTGAASLLNSRPLTY